MELIGLLTNFNLTRQEATVYIALNTEGALTGYEVSKLTGISRSNAYTTLASLVEKGAALTIEGTATRYAPLPPGEFCRNKIRLLTRMQDQILQGMPSSKEETEGYITIKGDRHISDKIKNMIEGAQKRLYISLAASALPLFLDDLLSAVAKGLKVVVITDAPADLPGAILHKSDSVLKQIRLITDSSTVLTGEIGGSEDDACLYSKKKNLVDLIKDSVKNEIKLIQLSCKGEMRT
jgi:sugar-specific transcriptional regulator TrmB